MKVYLIRHGESESNAEGRVSSYHTLLSEKGILQTKLIAEFFQNIPLRAIYTSPLVRTKQTAEEISKELHQNITIIETPLLAEKKDASSMEHKSRAEIPWDLIMAHRNDPAWRHEDGESFNDMVHRVEEMLEVLQTYDDDANILLVSHNSFIKYLLGFIALGSYFQPEIFYTLSDRFMTRNTGIMVLERKQKYFESVPSWYIESWMI